ncbi:surface-adhesin E family protein [Neisseria lisongii]|uniref:Surface-adhesin protein E-like domain-containing protein n=1 Tax=Neisseria lisongii TaxID=2912188 RepID=A0AAW5AIY8_9NEIS|nr:surface-adhesin E family protein [Neisseria lisongii]MCF7529837.1 hypothetical protein [Neisseria lisongii]
MSLKHFLIATLLGLTCATASAANWRYVVTDDQKSTYYYDRSTLQNRNGIKNFWVRIDVENGYTLRDNDIKYTQKKQRQEIDCRTQTLRIGMEHFTLNGTSVGTRNGWTRWEDVIPDTVGSAIYQAVCR